MTHAITSKENLALDLIFHWLEVPPRRMRSFEEWKDIARRIPKLEALDAYINAQLKLLADRGVAPYQICYFKAGDRYPWYEDFPTSLSKSTIRSALVKTGFWDLMHGRNPLITIN